jgi:hypothetical protein
MDNKRESGDPWASLQSWRPYEPIEERASRAWLTIVGYEASRA